VLPTCEELGIGFVPWSPLGQGFLTGKVDTSQTFDPTDIRSRFPRFTPEAMKANQPLVEVLSDLAVRMHVTPAQIALAWLLAQKTWIVPIPGTRRLERLNENLRATDITISPEDLLEISTTTAKIEVQGARGSGHERYG
jgi:aryl-alcohol dehydrogenase-like predicted oxidoreductase